MSAHRYRASPSAAGSFDTASHSTRELLSSQAYTSLSPPFASSASPSHTHRQRSGEWSSSEFARLLLTEQLPQYLSTEASGEQRQHHLQASSDEPAGDVTWTPITRPSHSPLDSWPSQSSLDLQFSLSNTSAPPNASPSHDTLPTPFEQHQVHQQQPVQFSQDDTYQSGEDNLWEQQLATSLFGDFPCPPFSDATPSSSSLPATAFYANVNASTINPTPLVSPEDRQLAYAPLRAFPGPPSLQGSSEVYRPLQPGVHSYIEPLSVAAAPVDPPKRVSAACRFCKARKLRCDGCHPCRQCQRRSVECLYQPETQARPSRRMTDPSFEAFRSTTAPAPSEGQRLSQQHANQRKRSCTSVAEASLRSHTPHLPASASAHSWSSNGSTSHSTGSSIASSSVLVLAGDTADGSRQDSSSNSSYKTAKGENQTSPGSSSTVKSSHPPTSANQTSRRNSSKGGEKSTFSTISIRVRPDRNRNDSETSAAHEVRYVCPFPGCASHFSTSGHARRHSRIHTVLEPFECPHRGCDKTFTRRDNCTQHQRARHAFQMVAYRKTAERAESKDEH
ncbi:hypothetical protein FA10DRAFT_304389 [Acaromyces ingoldii]|uniref:Zn(2)-C6 fungal-type domain-containing protein n=1 Tax=Acaromyces ingoldii TaxID=215250 RepID=A0A316YCE6_9BASI|nr:hypothetical protein FA10DRAFT_304389 [Acaromyces ingoldii]PWN86942.1 hypothetical protein FA10DRAFT_304389 [Acaromyces ingoldii]